MAQDIGTLLVRITADVSDLKKGVAQAQAEIKKLKDSADSGGAGGANWAAGFNSALGPLGSLVTGVGAFLGIAFSVYGALSLWSSAVKGFVSLMTTAIGTVDEYRMGIVSTAGMLTAITDRTIQPDLSKAYEDWKVYLDWLYRASLETDRKVASGGAEIFETAKQLAIRGIIPNNKDQVYTIGLLSDFIKTVTQGLSQRQQLIQEVRAMFEGAMRPGAQALAQFVAIDPDFREKFEEARASAIAMKDVTPIFDLLRDVMLGMTFAAEDMQNTFDSLYNTAKSGFGLLLIETFGEAYVEIVKLGWGLLDIYYKEGQLTEEGKKLSLTLSVAWKTVREAVVDFVEYIRANPEVVHNFVRNLVTFLGQAANMAIKLGQAIAWVVEKMGGVELQGAALAARYQEVVSKETGAAPGTVIPPKRSYWERAADIMSGGHAPDTEGPPEDVEMRSRIAAYGPKLEAKAKDYADKLKEAGGSLTVAGQSIVTAIRTTGKEIDREALKLAISLGQASLPFEAPPHPYGKIAEGKADKEKAGRTPGDAELLKKLNDAVRALEKSYADEEFKNYKALMDKKKAETKIMYAEGKLSISDYYDTMIRDATNAWQVESKILEGKIEGAKKAYAENLKAIDLKAQRRELTEPEVRTLKEIERVKMVKEIWEAEQQIGRLGIAAAKEVLDLTHRRLQAEIQLGKLVQEQQWRLMSLTGPVGEMSAKLEKMEADFWEKVWTGKQPGPGQSWQTQTFGPTGPKAATISGDELYLRMKAEKWEAEWGRFTRQAADAVASGFTEMIDSLITGSGDFKKTAQNMFKQLFNIAMKPGIEQLTQALKQAFDKMFKGLGESAGMAVLGVIALVGMMLLGGGKKSSFSPTGTTSQVTGHEAVRGVISGETSIPIAQIGTQLAEALVSTNGILNQIETNTRGLRGLDLNLNVNIEGLQELMAKSLEAYFSKMGMTGA